MEYINAAADDDANEFFADIEHHITSLHLIVQLFFYDDVREAKWHHRRIDWETHVFLLQHENLIKQTYRMSLAAFQKLTRILGKDIIVDEVYCPVDEPIVPEIVVAVAIRYLSGGKCLDLKTAYGLSLLSVYRCMDLFIVAVNASPELDIKMPVTVPKLRKFQLTLQQ
jgi:hypothetical protein